MPRYSEAKAREAIAASLSWAQALRHLGMCPTGNNHVTIKRYARDVWLISTDHFDPDAARDAAIRTRPKPLSEILVDGSAYSRSSLKQRLYVEGIKTPSCELCGQGDQWRGRYMALILDHINGDGRDNRLENLRIVCPNCAATFDTHCGRKLRMPRSPLECLYCGAEYWPKSREQRYCSRACGGHAPKPAHASRARRRKVQRPPYAQLLQEIELTSWLAVGRRYGVSDNAVRKWVRQYERELQADASPL